MSNSVEINDKRALVILNLIRGLGPIRLNSLLSHFGDPVRILEAGFGELCAVKGLGKELAESITNWRSESSYKEEMALADRAGVRIITRLDEEYPPLLKEIADAPICLYVRGTLDSLENRMIALVGSRRTSNYGRMMAEHLARSASFAGWTVVSGLAYGVDAVAHQAVLDAGGKTVAVLGGGLARIYPQDHVAMAKKIIETGGAIVSEFPMEFSPNRNSFPMRNRIISGISQGVIVVEAGSTSGSLITARFAIEQNRQIFAVPGQADNPQARGCNNLIRQGAKLTETFEDVLNEFEFLPGILPSKRPDVGEASELSPEDAGAGDDSDEEKRVLRALEDGDASADSLANSTGISAGELLAVLMRLEMGKKIVQLPGKRFALRKKSI